MDNRELYHYGIKGMKWGVRRTPAQLGRKTGSGKTKKELSPEEKARRIKTAKRVAAGVTIAAAAVVYAKNRKQIDAFVGKCLKEASDAKRKYDDSYFTKNRDKILNSPSQLNKYKDRFSSKEVGDAVKRMQTERDLHQLNQDRIRRGSNYIQAYLATATALSTAYNLKNSPIIKDAENKRKKKKQD